MKQDLKAICLAWEKLRLLYIGILVLVTMAGYEVTPMFVETGHSDAVVEARRSMVFLVALPFLAIAANLLYLFGPLLEVYLYFLERNHPFWRWLIFLLGMGLSALLAFEMTLLYSHYGVVL
jgi:hypothetical protein